MSHPIPEAPPVARALGLLRWHIHTITTDPGRYDQKDLTALADIGVELSQAALGELTRRGLS